MTVAGDGDAALEAPSGPQRLMRLVSDGPDGARPDVVDGAKLLRLQATLASVVAELRQMDVEETSRPALAALERRLLVELGSVLSDPLLDELRREVGPVPGADTSAGELRVVAAQLLGWAEGLLFGLSVAVPVSGTGAADGEPDGGPGGDAGGSYRALPDSP